MARIVLQPNGLYARFSSVVDDFTHVNMTYNQAVEMADVGRVELADREPDRFLFALSTIRMVHGDDAAKQILLFIALCPFPL